MQAHWNLNIENCVYRAVSLHPRTLQGAPRSTFRPACAGPGLAGSNAATALRQAVNMDEGAVALLSC